MPLGSNVSPALRHAEIIGELIKAVLEDLDSGRRKVDFTLDLPGVITLNGGQGRSDPDLLFDNLIWDLFLSPTSMPQAPGGQTQTCN
jgi:hypothetical protein